MAFYFKKSVFLQPQNGTGCGAVGSALRSGRRGRKFESSHPDNFCRDARLCVSFSFKHLPLP